jgi:two-component system, LuxR family, response regulator FixJ
VQPEDIIHIVDDDPAIRRSIGQLLSSAGIRSQAYAAAVDFLAAAPGLSGGCVLLDFRMPGIDGLEVQRRLKHMGVALPVIVMTGHGDVAIAVRAMKEGAADFIEKPFRDDVLISAITTAVRDVEHGVRRGEVRDAVQRLAMLSPRERQVLDALAIGLTNKEIGRRHGISPRTVEVHRGRMLKRLGVTALAGAIRLAVLAAISD